MYVCKDVLQDQFHIILVSKHFIEACVFCVFIFWEYRVQYTRGSISIFTIGNSKTAKDMSSVKLEQNCVKIPMMWEKICIDCFRSLKKKFEIAISFLFHISIIWKNIRKQRQFLIATFYPLWVGWLKIDWNIMILLCATIISLFFLNWT